MKENKLNVNRPPLTAEEISAYKDFGALQQRYASAQKFSYVKWGGAGLAAAAVALIVVLAVWKSPQGTEITTAQAFINPPLEHVNVAYTNYSVDAAQGGELNYETGSIIKIPQNAFLDKNGNVVTGKVDVQYREFHDLVDIFVSGIPMNYDSGGVQYHFESAGMVEIMAYQNNEPLLVNPNSKIDIAMMSQQTEDKYNLYYLDTVKKQWVNQGRDKIVQKEEPAVESTEETIQPQKKKIDSDAELKALATRMMAMQVETKEALNEKPMEPKKADNESFIFDFDVSPKEFPEIALYEGMYFQIGKENKNFNPALYKSTWEDAELRENVKGVSYLLRLKKGEETHEFVVYPVYKGGTYETAMKMYEQKYQDYQAELTRKKEAEQKAKEEYEARLAKLKADQQEQMRVWQEQQQTRVTYASSVNQVYRAFQVSGFGVWNVDRPFAQQWQPVIAKFTDKEGNPLNLSYAYVADRSRNMMITWYPNNFTNFRFSPGGNQMIWGVTQENKLAVFGYEEVKALPKGEKTYTFKMTTTDKLFTSVGEVKDYLGFSRSPS